MSAKTRVWIFGAAILCGVLILYGLLGGLLPKLTAADSTRDLAISAEDQNVIYETQLQALAEAQPRIDELTDEVTKLRAALPETAASREFLQQLSNLQGASNVTVTSFTASPPFIAEAEPAPAPDNDEATGEDGAAAGAPPTAAPATSGVQTIPFVLNVAGPNQAAVTKFVSDLQLGDRLITVDSVSLTARGTDDESSWEGSLSGAFYVVAGSGG